MGTLLQYVTTNITSRYGWLFFAALLSSAAAETYGKLGPDDLDAKYPDEQLNGRTFNLCMQGLNVDFMSYAALSLANDDVEALLDPNMLSTISARVFSTFF
jgi:hypothetical protein